MRTQANEALKPGTAGLFLLIRKMTTDKVLEDLKGVGGTVIRTSFDHAKEEGVAGASSRCAALCAGRAVLTGEAKPSAARAASRRRRWRGIDGGREGVRRADSADRRLRPRPLDVEAQMGCVP